MTHAFSKTRAYRIWRGCLTRCYNQNAQFYNRYGGRGILMCERWRTCFANFLADMGQPPEGLSLDRIDNDRGYEPDNCRWATKLQQARNTCGNVRLEVGGRTLIQVEWSEETGINQGTIHSRLNNLGWTPERAVTQQPIPRGPRPLLFRGELLTVAQLAKRFGLHDATVRGRLNRGYSLEDAVRTENFLYVSWHIKPKKGSSASRPCRPLVEFRGEMHSARQLAERHGIGLRATKPFRCGLTLIEALTLRPIKGKKLRERRMANV